MGVSLSSSTTSGSAHLGFLKLTPIAIKAHDLALILILLLRYFALQSIPCAKIDPIIRRSTHQASILPGSFLIDMKMITAPPGLFIIHLVLSVCNGEEKRYNLNHSEDRSSSCNTSSSSCLPLFLFPFFLLLPCLFSLLTALCLITTGRREIANGEK